MNHLRFTLFIAGLTLLAACSQQIRFIDAENPNIRYEGRVDLSNVKGPALVGSASYVELQFVGDSCSVLLKNPGGQGNYNYVSLELDGDYIGRLKISLDSMIAWPVVATKEASSHDLRIFKATEASNGNVVFGGINGFGLTQLPALPTRKIEFIGNSITCGYGVDWKEIPCHSGTWYDQHNAYFAYGPQSAMALNAQFMLSSVSGIGVYRNWNSLHPVMPEVYENLNLNTDSTKKWDFSRYIPDLVSICLGTNDFSAGDGQHERLPFDSARYVDSYISFIKTIYSHYPETQICLLTSPMVNGDNARLFERCVTAVADHFKIAQPGKKKIEVYFFKPMTPHGCDGHPDRADHKEMTDELVPFYKKVMGW